MWPLLIELTVSIYVKINTGKIYVTQGKLREFTLAQDKHIFFALAKMWPPWFRFT